MMVIAHRGASGHAPENTRASFSRALELGARAVELDVHQTRDGELIVAHDDDLRRCGGDRRRLRALSWEEASKVDVGSWFDRRFSGERPPRLEDVFTLIPASVELHVEIKHGSSIYPGIERRVVEAMGRRGTLARTVISSFDHRALLEVRAVDGRARLGYLLGSTSLRAALRETKALACESLHCSMRQVRARVVDAVHALGLKVLVYTVNTPADRDRLERLGVDGIFSNYPELDLWR